MPNQAVRALRAWTTENGLPQNSVYTIAQTPDGYLWLGTQEGLARFDGARFVVFDRNRMAGCSSNMVQALYVTGDGSLWIGTVRGGLLRLKDGVFDAPRLPTATVNVIREANDGTLWVGTDDGIVRLPHGSTGPAVPRELTGRRVLALHEAPDGGAWVGASDGLYRCRNGGCVAMSVASGLPPGRVSALWGDGGGNLWIGTSCCGLFRLAGGKVKAIGSGPVYVRGLFADRDGRLWVATDHGLKTLRGDRLETPFDYDVLSSRLHALFEDREGSLWIGTYYDGLVQLRAAKVAMHGGSRGLAYPTVRTVYEDGRGNVWFGTAGAGLGRLSRGGLEYYTRQHGLADDIIGPILEGRSGELWFGVRTSGTLHRLQAGRLSAIHMEANAASLYQDEQGSLWIGTRGAGLYRWRGGRLTRWTTEQGLPSDTVTAITSAPDAGLWLGTRRGLVHFREEGLTAVDGLPSGAILSLYRDPSGPLWVGTSGGGLARVDGGRVTTYDARQGLCDERIFSILDDGLGSLWMSCNKGIFQVPKRQLEDVAAGRDTTVSCTLYGRGDGMESSECNGGEQPAGWKGHDGRLWFATVKGLAAIDPAALRRTNTLPPPVWIEEARADGIRIPRGPGRLAPGTRRLEIDYTALSLVDHEKVRFRYRLVGFDRGWVDAGTRRSASYTSLPPGDYVFQVIACNNDGLWNEQGARWPLAVEPFFYQTGWFLVASALAVAAGSVALHRVRVSGLRLRNALLAERNRLSEEIHDRLSQIMTGVILQLNAGSQKLPEGQAASQPYFERAARLAREGMEEARRIVRGLRDPTLEGGSLTSGLRGTVLAILEGTDVRLRIEEEGRPFELPLEIKNDLVRIGQEAVTNALRHGEARQITVVVAFEADGLRLTVEDDGHGLRPSAVRRAIDPGLGLAGMARRVSERRGTLDVRERPGGGTTVAAFVPRQWAAD